MNNATLRMRAAKFEQLCKFTATNKAGSPDRIICLPGDEIEVERWHTTEGLTDVVIRSNYPRTRSQVTSIPWEWVEDAGAPEKLKTLMPTAPKTWRQILRDKGIFGF